MTSEPTITFLDLACAVGADPARAWTIDSHVRHLYRDAMAGCFPSGSLGWNVHANRHRLLPDEYPLLAVRADGRLDLSSEFEPITPRQIIETLAVDKWPEADRALDLFKTGADADAYRLVADGRLPDGDSHARIFVESLALTASEAWLFCERNGLPVPQLLCKRLGEWTSRRRSAFAPDGYIAIPDAVVEVRESLHPGEASRTRAELAHQTGGLPDSYRRHCENQERAEKLLLQAMIGADLEALAGEWRVPADYWETDGARVVTLMHGTLHTRDAAPTTWHERHGLSCAIEDESFRRWLKGMSARTRRPDASDAIDRKTFDEPYWTYMMMLAWVSLRDRAAVEQVAIGFADRRACSREERLPDGRREIIELPSGPMTPLGLTLLVASRGQDASVSMSPHDAKVVIVQRLRVGTLAASGLKNDAGDRQPISDASWEDLEINDEVSDGRVFAGPKDSTRSGATRWYELRFKREEVLSIWPDRTRTQQAGQAEVCGQGAATPAARGVKYSTSRVLEMVQGLVRDDLDNGHTPSENRCIKGLVKDGGPTKSQVKAAWKDPQFDCFRKLPGGKPAGC